MFIFLDIKYIQNNGNIFKCDFCKVHPYQLIRKGPKFFSSPLGLRLRWRPKDVTHTRDPRYATDYKVNKACFNIKLGLKFPDMKLLGGDTIFFQAGKGGCVILYRFQGGC